MNEQDLKLQAYLDGELPAEEAREVASWLAQDRDAVAQLHSLRVTRQALSTFESGIKVPETREFYWSKIRRDIERLELARPQPAPQPFLTRLRRLLVPAAGVALLLLAGILVSRNQLPGSALERETTLADSKAFTYRDYSSGTTLVWLSYPADNDASDETSGIN